LFDDDDGNLTRERKLRNVDNVEEEFVKIDEEDDDVGEFNDCDECVGKPSWWWWWW